MKKNRLIELTSGRRKEKIFCAYLTLGFPDLKATARLIPAFEKARVDILELGFPFSDPMADGPTIQAASEAALKNGVVMEDAFSLIASLRKKGLKIPVLFFSYFNPVFHYGCARFLAAAAKAGMDGVIIPDLPPQEEKGFQEEARKNGLSQVFLIAPTTGAERSAWIARQSEGFIYYVSLKGVTGARKALPSDVHAHLKKIKRLTDKPVLVGFGVSTPEQARLLSGMSDGVIVGSAIIDCVRKSGGSVERAAAFVRKMARAAKGI